MERKMTRRNTRCHGQQGDGYISQALHCLTYASVYRRLNEDDTATSACDITSLSEQNRFSSNSNLWTRFVQFSDFPETLSTACLLQ